MRLCSYVVTNDMGLAPNPFWGYCTLSVCTPNHMGVQAKKGDWFIGTTSVSRGNRLVFAMRVSDVLSFEEYFSDLRFEKKKPNVNGTWRQKLGDNMYYKDEIGNWKQLPTLHHNTQRNREQDTKHPYVFIAEHFYYFGDKAIEIPAEYKDLIVDRQGCKCNRNPEVVQGFLDWLRENYTTGVHGKPYNIDKAECDECTTNNPL
jgi:hypothetical protein